MRAPAASVGTVTRRKRCLGSKRRSNAMAYEPGRNPFNPLIIGAIAVVVALVAFLVFRDGSETSRQAGINRQPPSATAPAPNPAPPPVSAPQKTPQ
jgi:hypothetical protein